MSLAAFAVVLFLSVAAPGPQAWAQCATTATNQSCTNPAGTTVSGGGNGIFDNASVDVTNFGTVSGSGNGIEAVLNATVTNYGIISGNYGIQANNATVRNFGSISAGTIGVNVITGTVINSGTISGASSGIQGNVTVINSGTILGGSAYGINANIATVTNSGSIAGGLFGITANTVTVTNLGTISGATGLYAGASGPSTLVNSGSIIGTSGPAIDFHLSSNDTLTFLPGSRINGAILLGSGDSVSVVSGRGVSSLINFTPSGPFTLGSSGSVPFVISGTQIAVVDPTSFSTTDRTVMDFTRSISGLIANRSDEADARGANTPKAFAPTSDIDAQAQDAFAQMPGLAYANNDAIMFKNPTVSTTDGRGVWARGFAGERIQQSDGP